MQLLGGGGSSTTMMTQTWLHEADSTYSRARPKKASRSETWKPHTLGNSPLVFLVSLFLWGVFLLFTSSKTSDGMEVLICSSQNPLLHLACYELGCSRTFVVLFSSTHSVELHLVDLSDDSVEHFAFEGAEHDGLVLDGVDDEPPAGLDEPCSDVVNRRHSNHKTVSTEKHPEISSLK